MTRWLPALGLAVTLSAPAAAQVPPDKALATMQPADGLQVELFASEPLLVNPTAIDVDHLGRVWVAEAVNYRRKNFNRPILRPEGDRVVVLTDADGDGKADDSTVFYQGQDLYGPLSVLVLPQAGGKAVRVLVAQSPDILEFWDKDGDGKADGPPTKFLTGFGGFDHDHGVHGLTTGPDGRLYFTVGDAGVKGLQSKDGAGRKWETNSTDCQKGTVWRCDLDGKNLELIAHNFRNNYEACVDSFGEVWLSDNDDDGNQQTRICFVMPGGNYGYGPRGPGQSHWHEEQPGVVHKTLRTGFGSPTGICFYEGGLLPEKFRGGLLHTDAGPRELRCFHRRPKGAGYELDKTLMLSSTDNWFRPSDVCVGPDGSVFVADWYDPGVGGHGMGDHTRGRIYRVTPKGHPGYKVPAADVGTDAGLKAAFGSPDLAARHLALDRLRALPEADRAAWLDKLAGEEGLPKPTGARAAFQLCRTPGFERGMLDSYAGQLGKDDAGFADQIRRVIKAFGDADGPFALMPRILARKYGDLAKAPPAVRQFYRRVAALVPNPAASRELLVLLRDADPALAKDWFYPLARKYDGTDIFYRAALNIALGPDPARRDAILADFDAHFPEWTDAVADLVWELRPKSALGRLDKLLADPKLTPGQKARVVDVLAANDDPAAGNSVLALLTADRPPEVQARALDNLRLFLPTKWAAVARSDQLKAAVGKLLAGPAKATGLRLVAAAKLGQALGDVAAVAADRTAPADLRAEAVTTLGKLQDPKAAAALQPLVGDPAVAVPAVHALAELVTGRGESPTAKAALAALKRTVDGDDPPAVRRAGVEALAGTQPGTAWLLGLKQDGKLPEAVAADAARLLRNSPFQGERNKALLLFPAPGKLDLKRLPPPAELAKRTGDPARGQAILAATAGSEVQCLKCHMVRGQGGQIGPDLSLIGKKGSKENLFESILHPSKAVADQYVTWTVETADGQTLTGLLVQESDAGITIRDANGKDHPVPARDVDKRAKSPVSLMPDNLVTGLTEDELVDLVEYLTTLQTAALTPAVWQAAGLAAASGPDNAGAWKPVRAGAGGYVDLRALHGDAATDSVTVLRTEVESPADQEATVLLGTAGEAKLLVNGAEVFATRAARAAAPDQDRVTVRLKPGVNTLTLKVANGAGPHGVYLTILSGHELKAR